jgi:hypothetical protein
MYIYSCRVEECLLDWNKEHFVFWMVPPVGIGTSERVSGCVRRAECGKIMMVIVQWYLALLVGRASWDLESLQERLGVG